MTNNNNLGIHSSLNLYISDQAYVLTSATDNQSQSLTINRKDSQISLSSPGPPEKFDRLVNNVAGLLGIIRLMKSDYLVLIQSARKVTNVFKTAVYTPSKFAVYPISLEPNLSILENSDERYLLSVLKAHLDHALDKTFFTYLSKTHPNDPEPWNLTNSLQRQGSITKHNKQADGAVSDEQQEQPPWKASDDRFFWNKFIQTRFIELASQPNGNQASKFILPVIFGFLEFKSAVIKGKRFTFGIVSRRSRYRAGTRYFTRGINSEGDVSNFNETEMIMTTFPPNYNTQANGPTDPGNGRSFVKAGFVQTRGSVPLFWTEINNLRYRPDLKIIDLPESLEAMKAHFDQQVSIYGDQYLFNLVNSSGYEKAVKDGYERAVKELNNPRVHYTYFDFHQECKGLRFDRVQILIDQLHDQLVDQAYFFQEFSAGPSSNPASKVQKSVVRTNCMDCLDRTNVLQSALAKWVLTFQLKQAGILEENENLDKYPDFMFLFRNLWADNADGVSKSYSGTPALKTDFTRLGVRTKKGAFDDGVNSLMRYVKNNFMDGPRQDSYDLFTGAWRPPVSDDPQATQPLHNQHLFKGPYDHHLIQAIVLGFVIFLLIFISATFTKKRSLKLAIISLIILSLITRYIFQHGMEFVNQPRLKGSTTNATRQRILSYNGPSSRIFQSSQHGRTKINFALFDHFVSLLSTNNHHHLNPPPPHSSSTAAPPLSSSISGPNQSHVLDDDKKKRLD
ncbi:hypothetical protein PGT21_020571 [Puccinia graminis f. sp. tritici]|uniref:SAC domain-containing protein n=1 Tax=Puccinia graminis f. sp. tritici TaxID=56615 RepID=A0A5B0LXU7_PUCGR|nr:hypothetical protein PGT21_020571 [Puccinia graminis f. sp. tritici]